jgi:hypothetical protein
MDKEEYGRYLLAIIEEEEEEEEESDEDKVVEREEQLFGLFQFFMPDGKGVEAIFAPLEDGDVYLQRLTPIYEMLDPADFEGDSTPGYFNAKLVETSEETLKDYGQQFIEGLKQLLEDDEAASTYLDAIQQIEVLPPGGIDPFLHSSDADVHEALYDVIDQVEEHGEPIAILGEAYYSIACNYLISYYLQWPRYGLEGDPLIPYFELYRRGYSAVFSEGKLYIGAD